jgi:hypothetical protein
LRSLHLPEHGYCETYSVASDKCKNCHHFNSTTSACLYDREYPSEVSPEYGTCSHHDWVGIALEDLLDVGDWRQG